MTAQLTLIAYRNKSRDTSCRRVNVLTLKQLSMSKSRAHHQPVPIRD